MGEHRIPRDLPPAADPENFKIQEVATGLTFTIRDASDEQLRRHIKDSNDQHIQCAQQAMALIQQATQLAAVRTCLEYELDRRKRTITIATSLNGLSDLRRN